MGNEYARQRRDTHELENLKKREHLENVRVKGRIISK
jgi:hypothetical protein